MFNDFLTYNDVNLVPKYSDIGSRDECNTYTEFCGVGVDIPLVPANMQSVTGGEMLWALHKLGCNGILHRFENWEDELKLYLDKVHNEGVESRYALSVGVNTIDADIEKISLLGEDMPNYIVIDVAHGHSKKTGDTIRAIKEAMDGMPIVAGNVATPEGATFLAECGADAIKVGIGNGSLCETRIRTGVGLPQFSALMYIANELHVNDMADVQIIADGGVETPGDVVKALSLGADLVMSGSFFAGTTETPLPMMNSGAWDNPTRYKQYMGSASYVAKSRNGQATQHIEGNSKLIEHKGSMVYVMEQVHNGLKSAMSYLGARTLDQLRENASFVRVTPNGTREARPYLLG